MKKDHWFKRSEKIKQWADEQEESDNLAAILLSITLGDNASTDDLRDTYWTAIRSIGSEIEGFPFVPKIREKKPPRDGGLRQEFEEKVHWEKSTIKIRGRVVYNGDVPSLSELSVTGRLWVGEERIEQKVREICENYSIRPHNIHFSYEEKPKPTGRSSRYERTGRSGSYHGTNRWNPGL
jgi:hypothetical protein